MFGFFESCKLHNTVHRIENIPYPFGIRFLLWCQRLDSAHCSTNMHRDNSIRLFFILSILRIKNVSQLCWD